MCQNMRYEHIIVRIPQMTTIFMSGCVVISVGVYMCVNTILKTHEITDINDKGNCLAPARDVNDKLRLCLTC